MITEYSLLVAPTIDWGTWVGTLLSADQPVDSAEMARELKRLHEEIALVGRLERHVQTAASVIGFLIGLAALATIGAAVSAIWREGKTVRVANEVMEIAKGTTAHIADAAIRVAIQDHEQCTQRCVDLIKSLDDKDVEYRAVATTEEDQETVRVISFDINSVERDFRVHATAPDFSRFYGEQREKGVMKLYDICYFILGMYHHQLQQRNYTEAIRQWEMGLAAPSPPGAPRNDPRMSIQPRLRIWIAREQNNLGKHSEAAKALGSERLAIDPALRETPIGVAAAALRHESLFFVVDPTKREQKELDRVIKNAHQDLDEHSGNPRVATLLGNMLLVHEALYTKSPRPKTAKTAKVYFASVKDEDIWALLGLAQWHDLQDNDRKDNELERNRLAGLLREELASTSSQRREIHTVLIRMAAETQCDVWEKKQPARLRDISNLISGWNTRLHIYSPVRKRYVHVNVFERDMGAIVSGQDTASVIRS
jgi:hypothetical protein